MTTYEQPKDWIERHLVEDPGGLLACEPSGLNEELKLARQANEFQHQQLAALNEHQIAYEAQMEQQLSAKDAEIERLLCVLAEIAGSKSLTATPTQFYQHLQRIASDATMTQSTRR